ncbi:MAG: Inner membrane protein CreD [Desulfovibrio sp.]
MTTDKIADTTSNKPSDKTRDGHFRGNFQGRMPSFGMKQRFSGPLARCVFIGMLTIFLLFPLGLVRDVVYERMHLYDNATSNITSSWGRAQTVSGPALIIPYQVWKDRKEIVAVQVREKGKNVTKEKEVVTREYHKRYKVVLPTGLAFASVLDPEIRYRGIYRQALYTAPVDVTGEFLLPEATAFAENLHEIHWKDAWLAVGVTDLKTIAQADPVVWANKKMAAYQPGTRAGNLLGEGFNTDIPLTAEDGGQKRAFSLHLKIRGSGGIYFTPVGENTTISMKGTWNAPSFQGNLLPVRHNIRDDGFSAEWVIPNLTRTYPQIADFGNSAYKTDRSQSAITSFTAGVNLHEPVTLYRMVRRSVDYGILFIAVSFVALFAFELAVRQRMHMVQYAMVGLSMSLFYLVLLSLAEHISFGLAFVAAGAITVLMNAWYVGAVMRSKKSGAFMCALLAGLYAVLFSLLRMEDFSLLMGTGLVLAMMAALMYVTRKLPHQEERLGERPENQSGTPGEAPTAA